MRKQKLVSDNIYHVFNRGVEKRDVFIEDRDYLRFISDLGLFNDTKPAYNVGLKLKQSNIDSRNQYVSEKKLVDILAFCLMPNHFHLLLRQKEDDGISKFMNKIGVGYTNYFNLKYKRVGPLFQGAFKAVLINEESQFLYIPYYIHLNPLDLKIPNWKENGIKKPKIAFEFLDSYKWSSHRDYAGESSFMNILNPNPLNEFFVNPENYKKDFINFMKDFDFSGMDDLTIDSANQSNY